MAAVYPFLKDLKPLEVPLSLYLHIPFCSAKCDYCDFHSRAQSSAADRRAYVRRMAQELTLFLDILQPPAIATVFIGGGTPNLLADDELEELLTSVGGVLEAYDTPGEAGRSDRADEIPPERQFEWTLEANPEMISRRQLELLSRCGVNRLSLGLQSFSAAALKLLGRRAGSRSVRRALDTVTEYWKGRLSFDLISGIPERSLREEREELLRALRYRPGHLSLYSLTLEEGTPLEAAAARGEIEAVSEEWSAAALEQAREICADFGYRRYEVSNYAAPGQRSHHNLRYWRMEPYLGLGSGAVSTLPGRRGTLRLRGLRDTAGYAGEWIEPDELLLEHLMMGLRTDEGLDLARLEHIFGLPLLDLLPRAIPRAVERGLLRLDERRVRPTDRGMLLLDHLLLDLAAEIDTAGARLNSTPPRWPAAPEQSDAQY